MHAYEISDKSLEFVCPLCRAQRQQLCVMRSGEIRSMSHVERRDLVWAPRLMERSKDLSVSHSQQLRADE